MKYILILMTSLVLLSIHSISFATETGYEVELIIFEDTSSRYLKSEDWTYNDMLLHSDINSSASTQKKDPEYTQLNWESAKLKSQFEKLSNNSNFKILINKRWKQTGLDRNETFNIPLNSMPEKETDVSLQNVTQDIQQNLHVTESYITGNVKLIMSRYLHFNINLKYFKPQTDNLGNRELISYPIVNERRMKSREIHYIDHPLIGVVVLATPYKIKEENKNKLGKDYKTL